MDTKVGVAMQYAICKSNRLYVLRWSCNRPSGNSSALSTECYPFRCPLPQVRYLWLWWVLVSCCWIILCLCRSASRFCSIWESSSAWWCHCNFMLLHFSYFACPCIHVWRSMLSIHIPGPVIRRLKLMIRSVGLLQLLLSPWSILNTLPFSARIIIPVELSPIPCTYLMASLLNMAQVERK